MSGPVTAGGLFQTLLRIQQASKVPAEAVLVNRSLTREGTFDPRIVEKVIALPETTAGNRALLTSRILNGQAGNWGPRQAPCEITHGWVDNCRNAPLDRFLSVSKWMLPIYGALHLIPAVLFKRKIFLENPWRVLARAGLGTARSSAFLGVFVVIYQSKPLSLNEFQRLMSSSSLSAFFCLRFNFQEYLLSDRSPVKFRKEFLAFIAAKQWLWVGGMLSGLSIFVEEKRRRGELTMYVLPKGLESVWATARGRGLIFETGKYGEALVSLIRSIIVYSMVAE